MKEPVLYEIEPTPEKVKRYKSYLVRIKNFMTYMVIKSENYAQCG